MKGRRLTCSIRTDEAKYLSAPDLEAYALECCLPFIFFCQVADGCVWLVSCVPVMSRFNNYAKLVAAIIEELTAPTLTVERLLLPFNTFALPGSLAWLICCLKT
jgi:hypothetical protein